MATSLVYEQRPDPVVRGLVTVGALIVLFLGTRIPLPGLNPDLLQRIAGGAGLGRLSIFALGVAPIIAALAIVELLRSSIPPLGRWAATPDRAARLDALARALALALAAIQAHGS
jgi:preprotein translocase subunit SecY